MKATELACAGKTSKTCTVATAWSVSIASLMRFIDGEGQVAHQHSGRHEWLGVGQTHTAKREPSSAEAALAGYLLPMRLYRRICARRLSSDSARRAPRLLHHDNAMPAPFSGATFSIGAQRYAVGTLYAGHARARDGADRGSRLVHADDHPQHRRWYENPPRRCA
jgi:hypothetical protein